MRHRLQLYSLVGTCGAPRALPRFVFGVKRMFTPQEIRTHLACIERFRHETTLATMEGDESASERPAARAERARQFDVSKKLLNATAISTS